MGKITFVEHDNTAHVTEFEAGTTLMQVAVDNAVPGIDGDCGGECACGAKTSRLGCQVRTTDAMDGMTVHLPEFQM